MEIKWLCILFAVAFASISAVYISENIMCPAALQESSDEG